MCVAALLDLGADQKVMERALNSLMVDEFSISISNVNKSGLEAKDFSVILKHDNHDHDMEYLHGHDHSHDHQHEHDHHHEHRGLHEILHLIESADMSQNAKKLASEIFMILGKAEAKAHGVDLKQVHFHEVGAVDSIVDIIAFAVCMDNLGIQEVIIPSLTEGSGSVRCQHGLLPVPVPAVVNIVEAHHLDLRLSGIQGELVTPTGAAIAAAIKTSNKLPSSFKILRSGMGAGKRKYEIPSLLRVMIIEDEEENKDLIWKMETNIDDCSSEVLGYLMDKLFENGARDVHYIPVFMKKNRPAYLLSILCDEDKIHALEEIIFKETTSIGIRRCAMERTLMERKVKKVMTSLGEAYVKICYYENDVYVYPEYESVKSLCEKHHLCYQNVYDRIRKEVNGYEL